MALTATMYHFSVNLSDVDRGVYESLDMRVARHPSESARYLLTRTLGYCLSYEEGITFSKEGLGAAEEPAICIRDATGLLLAWIDIGSPSAERLHKASKAAPRVVLYTSAPLALLRREAKTRVVHKIEGIDVFRFEPSFLDKLEEKLDRKTTFDIVRHDGALYVTIAGAVFEAALSRESLVESAD